MTKRSGDCILTGGTFMKAVKILVPALLILYALYVVLLGFVDGGMTFDGTGKVQMVQETKTIVLPPYLRFAELWIAEDGTDADRNAYTNFMYGLPGLFGDAEMWVVVNWTEGTSSIHICESRGMEFMLGDYADVIWETAR